MRTSADGLGRPHLGPDDDTNVLCLCPNDHVRFDHGGIYLTDELIVIDAAGGTQIAPLRTDPRHIVSVPHVQYHRALWGSIAQHAELEGAKTWRSTPAAVVVPASTSQVSGVTRVTLLFQVKRRAQHSHGRLAMDDREATAEMALRGLVNEAHGLVRASGRPLDEFVGTALFSTERDDRIRGLGGFADAAASLRALPEAGQHYPVEEMDRLALQFVYAALSSRSFPDDPDLAAQETWRDFGAEAAVPFWTFRGVANLEFLQVHTSDEGFQNIAGPEANGVIRLTDEVIIAGRSDPRLEAWDVG